MEKYKVFFLAYIMEDSVMEDEGLRGEATYGRILGMKNLTIGIMAHVDAGKTTLSEGLLYTAGMLRETGRVDHGDAFLDTYALEKERGITIFSKQAVLPIGTLIDTPGHVDFAPETERVLGVLDYAILVISGTDGVQGHTRTLWRLLKEYEVPVLFFINKMDLAGADKEQLMREMCAELSEGCVDFTGADLTMGSESGSKAVLTDETAEAVAMLDETVLEAYLEGDGIDRGEIRRLIRERKLYPCLFGSALKNEGVAEFYGLLQAYTEENFDREDEEQIFAARVYKISRDEKGVRLTHIRVFSGKLTPKTELAYASRSRKSNEQESADSGSEREEVREKVDQIRRYSGAKFELLTEAGAGMVCALTGLKETYPGQWLGDTENQQAGGLQESRQARFARTWMYAQRGRVPLEPLLEPVLNYRLILPEGMPPVTMLPRLRELEEELPELHITWEKETEEIHVRVMGKVQTEILQETVRERYGVDVAFGQAQIVYKETVTKPVHGIGHYEPLRHYAEAHVGIEPLPPGSGVLADRQVSTDELDLNWQRLILTHFMEREHKGVRIGAPLTDVKLTVIGGRAHLKHTEGGDFRQATYRAIRHGLMQAECRVLEPYYNFRLSVPTEQVGRAMTDIERMCGHFSMEEEKGEGATGSTRSVLIGYAPVVTMQDYAVEVSAYTGGQGELSLAFHGYLPCHNEDEIVETVAYDPEADEKHPPGSVFCAHGAGYYVPWEEVADMAHVQVDWHPERIIRVDEDGTVFYAEGGETPSDDRELAAEYRLRMMDEALGVEEIDGILAQATHANQRAPRRSLSRAKEKTIRRASKPAGAAKPRKNKEKLGDFLLVDGYNVIHAWKELSDLAKGDLEQARGRLQDILCNYQGYRGCDVILVFDAYRVASHPTETFDYHNIHVVYTKTAETADQYIERFTVEKAERYHVTVVTSDGLEQIIIRGAGAHLLSARDFEAEVAHVTESIRNRGGD